MIDRNALAAIDRMQGQWLRSLTYFEPKNVRMRADRSGSAGISQRYEYTSDMAGLLLVLRFMAGGRQLRQRLGLRLGRQRLLVDGLILAGLAQLLPQADVERAA